MDSRAFAAEGHLDNGEFLLCLFLSVALLVPLVGTLDRVHLLCLHAAVALGAAERLAQVCADDKMLASPT